MVSEEASSSAIVMSIELRLLVMNSSKSCWLEFNVEVLPLDRFFALQKVPRKVYYKRRQLEQV